MVTDLCRVEGVATALQWFSRSKYETLARIAVIRSESQSPQLSFD